MTTLDGGGGWASQADAQAQGWHRDDLMEDYRTPRRGTATLRALGHWVGALASLALVAGIVLWGWQTVTREAHGVPIVRALAGEARIAPEAPGGHVVADQGLTLGSVQEGRGTAAAPESVTLTPSGTDLAMEDRLIPFSGAAPVAEAEPALAPALVDLVEAAPEAPPAAPAELDASDIVAATLPGVAASPRPSGRPAIMVALAAAIGGTLPPAAATPAPPPAEAPGAVTVQLGDFATEAAARAAWADLTADGRMAARTPAIGAVSEGGRDFWRLRAAGFAAPRDAVRLCLELEGEGIACVPPGLG